MRIALALYILRITMCFFIWPCTNAQSILLFEDFETGDFADKGWYDGFPDQRTTEEYKNGMYSYAGHFVEGAKTSGAGRHLFTPTDKLYMSYWVKYSTNYIGSGVGYHPHEWNILTTEDWIYQGPADTYLTLYIEQNAGRPILALQDSKNVDPDCILLNNNSFTGCNGDFSSYMFTENRSVASCNGLEGYLDRRDCFPSAGSTHGYYSSRGWDTDSIYFRNTPGPYYKNDWHFIETYFELNTIVEDKGIADGKIRYWYDGQLLISSDSILFRTAEHPDIKFNQLFYGPYIGVGSPVDQTWWVDDLTLADGIITSGIYRHDPDALDFNVFPNPSDGELKIVINTHYHGTAIVEIFDGAGKMVDRQELNDNVHNVDLQLECGLYFCRIVTPTNRSVLQKIVVF